MANDLTLRLDGLADLRKAAREVGPEAAKELQRVNKAAAESIRDTAQALYASMYVQRSGRHRAAIRATATQLKAQVHLAESDRAGGLLGQEFGSVRFGQFPPHAGKEGHFFYPTVREEVPRLAESYLDALDRAMGPLFDR